MTLKQLRLLLEGQNAFSDGTEEVVISNGADMEVAIHAVEREDDGIIALIMAQPELDDHDAATAGFHFDELKPGCPKCEAETST